MLPDKIEPKHLRNFGVFCFFMAAYGMYKDVHAAGDNPDYLRIFLSLKLVIVAVGIVCMIYANKWGKGKIED